jgi:N-formylglutamate amidohydrolase
VIAGSDTAPHLITCDHAGRELPRELGTLGLSRAERDGHIARDIGAGGVARRLATELAAFLIMQPYSRLVIDCNRPLDAASSIAQQSEYTVVPGNHRVSAPDADKRARSIFHPHHHRIRREIERRETQGQPTIFIAMHSFTPTLRDRATRRAPRESARRVGNSPAPAMQAKRPGRNFSRASSAKRLRGFLVVPRKQGNDAVVTFGFGPHGRSGLGARSCRHCQCGCLV